MSGETVVIRADAQRRAELENEGWSVVARSFGAELDASGVDSDRLAELVAVADDVGAVLELDASTVADYPGGVATRHEPLDRGRATPSAARRGYGLFVADGGLVAMTFVDLEGSSAEVEFTVVSRAWRGRGLGTSVKAASVLDLLASGVQRVRTGGSADNPRILDANRTVGFVIDEHWVTLERAEP